MTQNGRCESLTQPHHFISVLNFEFWSLCFIWNLLFGACNLICLIFHLTYKSLKLSFVN